MGSSLSRPEPPNREFRGPRDGEHPTVREVKRKLRARYLEMGDNEVDLMAETLSRWENVRERYFKHLLEPAVKKGVEETFKEACEFPQGYCNPADRQSGQERLSHGLKRIHHLQVKLLWYEVRDDTRVQKIAQAFQKLTPQSAFSFGPFHVALQFGDVMIEWNDSSLIIPYPVSDKRKPLLVASSQHPEAQATPLAVECPLQGEPRLAEEKYTHHLNILLDMAENKEVMINAICDLIVLYNTKYHYDLFSSNCQHFAKDILAVLGRDRDAQVFEGRMREYADIIMQRGMIKPQFSTHRELDEYVQREIEDLSFDDQWFCYSHYLLFHLWGEKFPHRQDWYCGQRTCKLHLLMTRMRDFGLHT